MVDTGSTLQCRYSKIKISTKLSDEEQVEYEKKIS